MAAWAQGNFNYPLFSASALENGKLSSAEHVSYHQLIGVNTPINYLSYHGNSFGDVTQFIESHCTSDVEIVYGIYTWIANNIDYDLNAFENHVSVGQDAYTVFGKRKAICTGFAHLFQAMCQDAGLNCRLITGYAKGFGYKTGDHFDMPNHIWNAVLINGKWQLLDVTWASTNREKLMSIPDSLLTRELIKFQVDRNFLVAPDQFIYTHLPEDPYWQLLDNTINLQCFETGAAAIKTALDRPANSLKNFEALIAAQDHLDSLDRTISYLERMLYNDRNGAKEYGLGIAYFYKAQLLLKKSEGLSEQQKSKFKQMARAFYKKSLDQLALLEADDSEYEFSVYMTKNIRQRMEILQ